MAAWTYDNSSVTNGLGQVATATSHDAAGNTYTTSATGFDARGRTLGTTVTIPSGVTGLAGSYTTNYTYDAADHITKVNYPATGDLAAETVTTAYDSFGRPTTLTSDLSGTTYVGGTTYDDDSRLATRTYGATADTHKATRTYTYQDTNGTGALSGIQTTIDASTTPTQDDAYTRNDAGDITALADKVASQQQCFTYNALDVLTKAWTQSTATTCNTTGTADFTAGPDPYQTAYTYDRLGNLQTITDTDSTGTATTRAYRYPGQDETTGTWTTPNLHPVHGVTTVQHKTSTGAVTSTDRYTYNAAGQMLTRDEPASTTTPTASTTAYTWTGTGRLSTVTTTKSTGSQLTRYAYDASGTLIVRTSPAETVAYLTGQDIRTTNGTTKTATRYYTVGGTTVAMRTSPTSVTWLMADQQASTQLSVNATTGAATRRRYTPYGDQRGTTGLTTGTDQGFLGQTEDTTTNLSLLGARAYDPLLGRFLSPDPLNTPYDPANLSAYSYARNKPTTYTDPTGLCAEIDCPTRPGPGYENTTPGQVPGKQKKTAGAQAAEDQGTNSLDSAFDSSSRFVQIFPGVSVDTDWKYARQYAEEFREEVDTWCKDAGPDCLVNPVDADQAEMYQNTIDHLKFLACVNLGHQSGCMGKVTSMGTAMAAMAAMGAGGGEGPGALNGGGAPGGRTSAGSTGRTAAGGRNEQLAMDMARQYPQYGNRLPLTMKDPRWPAEDGWVKMEQTANGVEVHYVYNTQTGQSDDFKYKDWS